MYRLSNKIGLGVAILVVVGLLLYAKHATPTSGEASAPPPTPNTPTNTQPPSSSKPKAISHYLDVLQRIDRPAEATERRAAPLFHRELPKHQLPMPLDAQRAILSIVAAYRRAAGRVSKVTPTRGFAHATSLLAQTYRAHAKAYLATLALGRETQTLQQDPYGVLTKDQAARAALDRFEAKLTSCRQAFENATAKAGVAYPHWIAALINNASGAPYVP